MRILFLSAWCPFPADNGAKLRTYHLLRGLSRQHEVDLISFCPEGDDGTAFTQLRSFCRRVTLLHETPFAERRVGMVAGLLTPQPRSLLANHSRAMERCVRHQWQARPYDVVVASELHMVPYALTLPGARLVLEGLELVRLYDSYRGAAGPRARVRSGLTWWKTAQYVRTTLRRFAGYTVVSTDEAAIAAALAPSGKPGAVVPNGVDLASCALPPRAPLPDQLIYPGALSYDANFDAVAYFAQAILPIVRSERPTTRLWVTGKVTPAQIGALPTAEGLEFTGYLNDVRPTVASAWAEVVPLRKGAGTRLKVLEALALGTPIIATSKGVEGLGLAVEREVLIGDTPEVFAAATVRLLGSPDLRRHLAAAGRTAVTRYDWSHSVARLDELLERVCARGEVAWTS